MKLRREKDNPEDQGENAEARCFAGHVVTKTEFRQEWLLGQVNASSGRSPLRHHGLNLSGLAFWPVTGARLWVRLGGWNRAVGR